MSAASASSVALVALLVGVALGFVLDLPGGPAGWRRPGPTRWAVIAVTAAVVLTAAVATWLRVRP